MLREWDSTHHVGVCFSLTPPARALATIIFFGWKYKHNNTKATTPNKPLIDSSNNIWAKC